jgi:hypothetical protein
MKMFKSILALPILATALWSCSSETVAPRQTTTPTVQNSIEGIQRPSQACGTSQFVALKDANNVTIGTVEILNTQSELFLLVDMTGNWLLQGAKIFAGNSLDLPRTNNGNIQLEEFPHQFMHGRAQDKSTFRISLANLPNCNAVTFFGQAAKLNMFGQVIATTQAWGDGTTVLNGKMFNFCSAVCPPTTGDGSASSN